MTPEAIHLWSLGSLEFKHLGRYAANLWSLVSRVRFTFIDLLTPSSSRSAIARRDDLGPAADLAVWAQATSRLPLHWPHCQTGLKGHLWLRPLQDRLLQKTPYRKRYGFRHNLLSFLCSLPTSLLARSHFLHVYIFFSFSLLSVSREIAFPLQ